MRLSPPQIRELQALYLKHFHRHLSEEEAQKNGIAIMRMVLIEIERKGALTDMDIQTHDSRSADSHTAGDGHGADAPR